jgi:hypothetical protein
MVRERRSDAAGAAAMLVAAAGLMLIATSSLGVRPEAKLGINLYEYHTPGGYAGAEEDYDALVAPSEYFATDEKVCVRTFMHACIHTYMHAYKSHILH